MLRLPGHCLVIQNRVRVLPWPGLPAGSPGSSPMGYPLPTHGVRIRTLSWMFRPGSPVIGVPEIPALPPRRGGPPGLDRDSRLVSLSP